MMFLPAKSAADALFDEIHSDVFQAIERAGELTRDEWKERISVPVEFVTGPRGGTIVIRSLPGEPPRKESGLLYDSVESLTESDADTVTVSVDTDVVYGLYLNEGTTRMAARPHEPDVDQFAERMLDAIVAGINGD